MSKIIANNTLEVRLDSYGNATVRQASCDAVWNPDQSESIPGIIHTKEGAINLKEAGRIDIRKLDAGFHIVYGDFVRNGQSVDGCLEATILLEGHDVVFRIDRLDLPCDLISVEYPYRAFALKAGTPDGYLVLPFRGGCLVPTEDVLLDPVAFWFACDHSRGTLARGGVVPSVPVFGARDARAGYVGVLETPTDVTLSYMLNYDEILRFVGKGERSPFDRLTVAWPNWLCQKGELGYARAVRYTFQENMDYVRMARHYREHARKTGLLVTLRDKEKARPQLGLIEGAPYVAYYAGYPHVAPPHPLFPYKYSDLEQAVRGLKDDGIEKAFVHFWGGFKSQPPGALPFDTEPGTVAELRQAVKSIHDMGYLFTFYNDVSALLEESDSDTWDRKYFIEERDGQLADYRWGRSCSSWYVDFAKEMFPTLIEEMGIQASYIDCICGANLKECYSDEHPMDKRGDAANRIELFKYLHDLGLIYGSEHLAWWAVPHVEYANDVGMLPSSNALLSLHPIPLFHLAFHDCVIPYCAPGDDYGAASGWELSTKILRDVLYGVPSMFFINLSDAEKWRPVIRDTHQAMYPVLKHTAFAEMTGHSRSADGKYQESFFGEDHIRVNFDIQERNGLPPRSYVAECDGKTIRAQFSTKTNVSVS